jgi:hypothetical protein
MFYIHCYSSLRFSYITTRIMPFFLSFFAIPNHVPLILFIFPSIQVLRICSLSWMFAPCAFQHACLAIPRHWVWENHGISPSKFRMARGSHIDFLHISELWQLVFCRFASFLVCMLTLYFLLIMETFIVHLVSLFPHPVNKGVYAHD